MRRRYVLIALWIAAGLAGLVALVLAAIVAAGNTQPGREWLAQLTARLTDGHVRIEGLAGTFPTLLEVRRLSLWDARGMWLTGEDITLHWEPLALLRHRVRIDTLQVRRLAIERMPVSEPQARPERQTRLPRIHVRQLGIDTLELGPQLTGERTTVNVRGTVHVMSLEDVRTRLLALRTSGQGRYEVNLRFDSQRMEGAVQLEEPAGGPLAHIVRLPTLGALHVTGTLTGPRQAERLSLSAEAGSLTAMVQGFVDLTHHASHLDYSVQSGAMQPRPDVAWQKVDLKGSFHGPWTALLAQGRALIEGLRLPGEAQVASLVANLGGSAGRLAAHAQAQGVVLPGPQPGLLQGSPLTMDAVLHLNQAGRPVELTAQHALFSLTANGVTEGSPAVKLTAQLKDLAPLGRFAGQTLGGAGKLEVKVARRGGATDLNLTFRGDVSGGGQPDWGQLLGRDTQLQLVASLTQQRLTVQRMKLVAGAAALDASGSGVRRVPGATGGPLSSLEAKGTLHVDALAALFPGITGRLQADLAVSGPPKSLTATVDGRTTLTVQGSPPSDIEAHVQARGLPSSPGGTILAQGTLDGAPLQVHAALEREPGNSFHLRVHDTGWKSLHAQADLRAEARLTRGHGDLSLRIEHLEDLEHLTGVPLKGRVNAQASLTAADGQTHAQLQVSAQEVLVAGVRGSGQLSGSGPLSGAGALPLQLSLQLSDAQGAPLHLEAAAHLRLSQREVELMAASGTYHNLPVRLLAPARIRFGEELSVGNLRLSAQNAQLVLQGRLRPDLDLRVSLTQVDAALVNALRPETLSQGHLSGQAQLRGSLKSPQGHVQLKVSDLKLAQAAGATLPAVTAQGDLELPGDGTAKVDAKLSAGSSQVTLHGHAALPAAVASAPLDLALVGKLDLALANPMLETQGRRAEGTLTMDAHVAGTLGSPQFEGKITLEQGDLRDYTQGVHLSHVQALLTGNHGVLEVNHLTARAASGDVNVTGTIALLQPHLPVDLHLTARRAQPLASDILTANLDADLDLKGTLTEQVTLSGTIHIIHASIGIPNSLPQDVAVLDVRRPGEAPPASPERPVQVLLDVRLDAPRQILVTGRGLDAELGGSLHVRGTKDQPAISGGFDMIRGTLSLASTSLNFTAGRVSFSGAGLKGRLEPTLDFTAQSSVADSTVILRITGLADAPQFNLSSSPQELPQDEILSRLLFGQSASQLSAAQLVSVGSAFATLTGVGSGVNPLVKVQKTLGLDRLSVSGGTPGTPSTQQSTGATVEAGRYVVSNVYVAARQSTTGVTQLVVDLDITRSLKVRTRLGTGVTNAQGVTPENDPGSSIGVSYQFEY